RLVEPELELRDSPQPEAPADLTPHERRGAIEGPRGLLARLFVAERRVVDARELQVGRDGHAGQRDEADPRIVHRAAAEQLAQLLADLLADTVGAVAHTAVRSRLGARVSNAERAPSRRVALRAPRKKFGNVAGEAGLVGSVSLLRGHTPTSEIQFPCAWSNRAPRAQSRPPQPRAPVRRAPSWSRWRRCRARRAARDPGGRPRRPRR